MVSNNIICSVKILKRIVVSGDHRRRAVIFSENMMLFCNCGNKFVKTFNDCLIHSTDFVYKNNCSSDIH